MTPRKPNIHRLIDLQKMLLSFQAIDRVVYLPGERDGVKRRENDTEHSYNLAMTAWFLAQYFAEIDQNRVIRLALVHDLVEVHAGDTFPFNNPEGVAAKPAREAAALKKLAAEWADFPEMLEALHAYEARESAEARFVYALDKIMPPIVNLLEGGTAWQENNVTLAHLKEVKTEKAAVSPQILPYYEDLLEILSLSQHLFASDEHAHAHEED